MASTSPHGNAPDAVQDFRRCVHEVLRIADSSCGVESLETALETTLRIVRDNLHLKAQFETEIVSLMDTLDEGVVELVSFVMHELRWSPVKEEIERRLANPTGDVSERRHDEAMLDAFYDTWRDRDLYKRFG
ncbi:hypothetical protein [Streptomyces sp. 8N706]|uniref:hypothetical protein n=1 Tax=Streptomyces sp. 8N706 TaxID=3457416 RepID=UPI003FD458C3